MKDYVDSAKLQEYTTKLVTKLKTIFPGTPTAVLTAAEMTDHSKIYVYAGTETGYTAGDWYYWDGTAWASGGVYNAEAIVTDTTLSVPGMAADAKAAGDKISDIRSQIDYGFSPTTDDRFIFQSGKNRTVSNGTIVIANKTDRGSCIPLTAPTRYIKVVPKSGTTVGIHGFYNNAWVSGSAWGHPGFTDSQIIDTSVVRAICLQIIKTGEVTDSDMPDVYTQADAEETSQVFDGIRTLTAAEMFNAAPDSGRAYKAYTTRLTSDMIVVHAGDVVTVELQALKCIVEVYRFASVSADESTGWILPGTAQVVNIEGDGLMFVRFATESGTGNITPSDYDATVKIYRTLPSIIDWIRKTEDAAGILLPQGIRRIAFFGDSITAGSGVTGVGESLLYHQRLGARFGWTCLNYGYGGSGYVQNYGSTGGYRGMGEPGMGVAITSENKIDNNNFVDRITTVDTSVDALVIFGGTNDWGHGISVSAFTTAVESLFTYVQTNFVGKPIIVMTPLHRINDTTAQSGGGVLKDYVDVIRTKCEAHGLMCVDLYSDSGLFPDNSANNTYYFKRDDTSAVDGTHPNGKGHRNIADIVADKLAAVLY